VADDGLEWLGPWQLRNGMWKRPYKGYFHQEAFDGKLTYSDPDGLPAMIDSGPHINWIAAGWTQWWLHGPTVKGA
jgi:hypothetical protein